MVSFLLESHRTLFDIKRPQRIQECRSYRGIDDDAASCWNRSTHAYSKLTVSTIILQYYCQYCDCMLLLENMIAQAQRTIRYRHRDGHPSPSRYGTTWPALVVLLLLCSTQRSYCHPSPLPPYQLILRQTTTLLPLRTCVVCRHSHTTILGPVTQNSQWKHPQVSYSAPVDLGNWIRIFSDG